MNKILRYSFVALMAMMFGNVFADTDVTFTFNTTDGITELGITLPAAGKGTKVESINKGGVNIAATTASGKTDTRIYQGSGNNAGKYDFRIYQNGTLTFTAGTNNIKKVAFTGANLDKLSGNGYTKATDNKSSSWEGDEKSVTLTATGSATIYTIVVTYGVSTDSRTTTSIEFAEGYQTRFTYGVNGESVALPTTIVKAGGTPVNAIVSWSLEKSESFVKGDAEPAIEGNVVKPSNHSYGDLTLTASYEGDTNNKPCSSSYTLKVYSGYTTINSILEDFPEVGSDTWKGEETKWNAGKQVSYWQVDAKSPTDFTAKDALVTYVKNSYTYIRANDGCLLLYGSSLGLKQGDIITGDKGSGQGFDAIYGTLKTNNGLLELVTTKNDIKFIVKSNDNTVEPKTITVDQLTQANMNEYLKIENAVYQSTNSKNITFTVGEATLNVYNQFSVDVAALEVGATYTVTGMGSIYYKNEVATNQLYLTSFTKTAEASVNAIKTNGQFQGKMYNTAGQVVNKGYKGLVIQDGRKFVNK